MFLFVLFLKNIYILCKKKTKKKKKKPHSELYIVTYVLLDSQMEVPDMKYIPFVSEIRVA